MDIVSTTPVLEAALHYAKLGYKVFPVHGMLNGMCTCCKQCEKPGKHPATKHGLDDATTDENIIRKWWTESPWLNIAIAPNEHTLGLDIDPRHEGDKTLVSLEAQHGALPLTPCVKTGSGGTHLYYALPEGVVVKNLAGVRDGIDTRSKGGYLLAPPSKHECGGQYEWRTPLDSAIADAPDWLLSIVSETAMPSQKVESPKADAGNFTLTMDAEANDLATHPGASEGYRHHTIMRLLGIHFSRGDSIKSIEAMAIAWGKRCKPPMPEKHVLDRIRSLEKRRAKAGEGVNSLVRSSFADAKSEGSMAQSPILNTSNQAPKQNSLQSLDLDEEYNLSLNKNTSQNDLYEDLRISSEASKEACCQSEAGCPDGALAKGDWPVLHPDALHGLAGAITQAIMPETEADPVAVLLSLLASFGNAVGRTPHYDMAAGTHYANLYLALVGDTSCAKGQSLGIADRPMKLADPEWLANDRAYGLSSGEGLVDRVKDDEIVVADAFFGVPEAKRLLCVETEFVRPITAMRREGNTLSALVRSAWDGIPLEVLTRGKSKLKASNAHISIIAHITPEELTKVFSGSVETANGFSNRFLWACIRRSNSLPDGGDASVLAPFGEPLRKALDKAKTIGQVKRSDEAKALWHSVYDDLTRAKSGAYGMSVSRGHAQTLRLSLIYALLDGSEVIRVEHLRAALAVWAYCDASARRLFGGKCSDSKDVTGREGSGIEPLDLRLYNAIANAPGITRSGLHEATGNRVKASDMDAALASLESKRLVHKRSLKSDGGGRPSERWYPGTNPDGDEGCEKTKELNNSFDGVFTMGSDDGVGSNSHAVAKELTNELTPASEPSPSSLVSSQISFFAEPNDKEKSPASQPHPLNPITSNHDRSQSLSETEFMAMLLPESITKETTQTESDEQYQMETYAKALSLEGLTLADAEQVDKLTPKQKAHAKWSQEYALARAKDKARMRSEREGEMTREEFEAAIRAISMPSKNGFASIPMPRSEPGPEESQSEKEDRKVLAEWYAALAAIGE